MATSVPVRDMVADLRDVEWMRRDEDHVGAPGQSGLEPDPSGVPPHDLENHHSVVALSRRMEPVDRIGGHLDGGVEPERVIGSRQVVVDRLGNSDDVHAFGPQLRRAPKCAFAPDDDKTVDVRGTKRLLQQIDSTTDPEGVDPGRPQDGSAAVKDPSGTLRSELDGAAVEESLVPVPKPEEGVAVVLRPLADDR